MKKVFVSLALAALLLTGVSQARSLIFDDSGFDYLDDGIGTAYVGLALKESGELAVEFTSQSNGGTLATVDVEDQVPGYDGDDTARLLEASLYRAYPQAGNLFGAVDLDYRGRTFHRVTLNHDDQSLEVVKENYLTELASLGFDIEAQARRGSNETFVAQNGDTTVQISFTRQGSDTRVSIKTL